MKNLVRLVGRLSREGPKRSSPSRASAQRWIIPLPPPLSRSESSFLIRGDEESCSTGGAAQPRGSKAKLSLQSQRAALDNPLTSTTFAQRKFIPHQRG